MAMLLETLRSKIVTSLYGRRFGLDRDQFILGPKDLRHQVEDITSTAATSAAPYGTTRVLTSGSSQTGSYTLQAPIPGVRKTLVLNSTSTGGQQFTATNATIYSASDGTSKAVVNLYAPGAAVQLEAVSTNRWAVIGGSFGTTTNPLVSYTTST